MQLSYSEAYRYSEILEIMANPYALMVCDHLFETKDFATVEELAKLAKTTESKINDICYKLEHKEILDKEYVDGKEKYRVTSSTYSYFAQQLINLFD